MLKGARRRGWDEGCYLEKLSPWQPPFPPPSGHRSPVSMKVSPPPSWSLHPRNCRHSPRGTHGPASGRSIGDAEAAGMLLPTASEVPHAMSEKARASPQCSTQGMAAPTPLCPKATPLSPCLCPHGRSNTGVGATLCCRTWGWTQARALTQVLLGLGQRSKCVPSLRRQPWVLRFHMISVIYFN